MCVIKNTVMFAFTIDTCSNVSPVTDTAKLFIIQLQARRFFLHSLLFATVSVWNSGSCGSSASESDGGVTVSAESDVTNPGGDSQD